MMRMMTKMSEIISSTSLRDENIKKYDYTNTLLVEENRLGILSEDEISTISAELMNALADVIGYFTKNELTFFPLCDTIIRILIFMKKRAFR